MSAKMTFAAVLALMSLNSVPFAKAEGLGQDKKSIDRRLRSEDGNFVVAFAATKRVDSNDTGHAFVIWSSEDAAQKQSVEKAIGFYPLEANKAKLIFQTAAGSVFDDSKSKRDFLLQVRVNEDRFRASQAAAKDWENSGKSYGILFNDCVSFVEKIASAIGLKIPARPDNVYPDTFVPSLIKANNN